METTTNSLEGFRKRLLATGGLPAVPFARVPVNELWTAKRVLDAGVLGVMFPFTNTPEMARQAVAACKYPPAGPPPPAAGLPPDRLAATATSYSFCHRQGRSVVRKHRC